MKKFISILTALAFAAALTVGSSAALIGDANDDGKINSADALLILRNTVGLIEFNEDEKNAANVNTDGIINSLDALIVLQITAGISSIWDFV